MTRWRRLAGQAGRQKTRWKTAMMGARQGRGGGSEKRLDPCEAPSRHPQGGRAAVKHTCLDGGAETQAHQAWLKYGPPENAERRAGPKTHMQERRQESRGEPAGARPGAR